MSQEIQTQPRLYVGSGELPIDNEEAMARITRLKSLQDRIAKKPEVYMRAFTELGVHATDEVLDIHDGSTTVRDASRSPKKHIKEYFAKRDDKLLDLDEASDESIFATRSVMAAIAESTAKKAILKRKGVMGSTLEENPEAREASNTSRREIFGAYLGRVVGWERQQAEKQQRQAG